MSLNLFTGWARGGRFPRASGDEPTFGGYTKLTRQFSPRERG